MRPNRAQSRGLSFLGVRGDLAELHQHPAYANLRDVCTQHNVEVFGGRLGLAAAELIENLFLPGAKTKARHSAKTHIKKTPMRKRLRP